MITFENRTEKYRYIMDKYGMDHVCLSCGYTFGVHSGAACPAYTKKGEFLLREELEDSNNPNVAFQIRKST